MVKDHGILARRSINLKTKSEGTRKKYDNWVVGWISMVMDMIGSLGSYDVGVFYRCFVAIHLDLATCVAWSS